MSLHACRFHDASKEPVLDTNVAPYLDDNTQLSIGQYRDKLYEVCVWGSAVMKLLHLMSES